MGNMIIYGKPGIGKTHKLLNMASSFTGEVFLVDLLAKKNYYPSSFQDFTFLPLNNLDNKDFFTSNRGSKFVFNTNEIERKFILDNRDAYVSNINIAFQNLINYVSIKGSSQKILIAIDPIEYMDLSFRLENGKSILLNLLELNSMYPNVSVILIVAELSFFKSNYRRENNMILSQAELFCPNYTDHFSGELRIRFPKELHKHLVEKAALQGVSLNSYINFLLTRGVFDVSYQVDNDFYDFLDSHDFTLNEAHRLIERFTDINKDHQLSVDLFFDWYVKEPKKAYVDEYEN